LIGSFLEAIVFEDESGGAKVLLIDIVGFLAINNSLVAASSNIIGENFYSIFYGGFN